jgi:hypothetical protein
MFRSSLKTFSYANFGHKFVPNFCVQSFSKSELNFGMKIKHFCKEKSTKAHHFVKYSRTLTREKKVLKLNAEELALFCYLSTFSPFQSCYKNNSSAPISLCMFFSSLFCKAINAWHVW